MAALDATAEARKAQKLSSQLSLTGMPALPLSVSSPHQLCRVGLSMRPRKMMAPLTRSQIANRNG